MCYGFSKISLNLCKLIILWEEDSVQKLVLVNGEVSSFTFLSMICLFFSEHFQIANYADDSSLFEFSGSTDDVIRKLEENAHILLQWFKSNYLKPNPDKWKLLLSDNSPDMKILIKNEFIVNSTSVKILRGNFDNKISFNLQVDKLC